MEKEILGKLYGNMNFNTYRAIENADISTIYGLLVAKSFILDKFPVAHNATSILLYTLFAYYLGTSSVCAGNYTRDVREIKSIYDELITKCNKLNDTFCFNNPVEIYAMFCYLIYNGYLSKNKQFEFTDEQVRDIDALSGANVVNGKAVCRHIAPMLRDIYNNRNIESSELFVHSRTLGIKIRHGYDIPEETVKQLYESIKDYISDEAVRESVNKIIAQLETGLSLSISYKDDKFPLARLIPNHMITMAVQDGISYIVDPTQTTIYKMSSTENGVLVDKNNDRIKIFRRLPYLFRDSKNIKTCLNMPSTTFDEDFEIIERTKAICKDNLDMFEQFYDENSEMYDEISEKLLKIKETNRLIKKLKR